MNKKSFIFHWIVVMVATSLQACSTVQQMIQGTPTFTPTITSTHTPIPTPTATLTATITPSPTATPDFVATQQYTEFFSWVEKLVEEGLISSVQGDYILLDEYSDSFAKAEYYRWFTYDNLMVTNYIIQAKIKTESAVQDVRWAGCGFAFGGYDQAVFLTEGGNIIYNDAFSRKSNYLDSTLFENSDEVTITLLINEGELHFFVNDRLGLHRDNIGFGSTSVSPAVLSGTNEGFGTHCDFTDMVLWIID